VGVKKQTPRIEQILLHNVMNYAYASIPHSGHSYNLQAVHDEGPEAET
jgi:hypothetical protein